MSTDWSSDGAELACAFVRQRTGIDTEVLTTFSRKRELDQGHVPELYSTLFGEKSFSEAAAYLKEQGF